MATFLLIHGAWHGAWCWERIVPLLESAGHRVIAPDLPGHGADDTPWWKVTLSGYARRACDAASPAEPVIAVGHSLGGLVITQAAHRAPERFAALIYLTAFVPQRGESLLSLGRSDAATRVPQAARWGAGRVSIRPQRAADAFYNTCSAEDAAFAAARLCPTPILPIFQGAAAPAPSGIPLAYLECSEDRAVPLSLQRRMHRRFPMERVATLETDHSPFLCAPEALARHLDALAGIGAG